MMGWNHTTLREQLLDTDVEELMDMLRDIHRVITGRFQTTEDRGRRVIEILRRLVGPDESGLILELCDEDGYCLFCAGHSTNDPPHEPDCPWAEAKRFLSSLES